MNAECTTWTEILFVRGCSVYVPYLRLNLSDCTAKDLNPDDQEQVEEEEGNNDNDNDEEEEVEVEMEENTEEVVDVTGQAQAIAQPPLQ